MQHFFRRLNTGYYTYLLFFLILLFAWRPYDQGSLYVGIWKFFFACTFITAIFNCKHRRPVKLVATILAIPTIAFTWLDLYFQNETFFILNVFFTIAFLGICTTSILIDVILRAKVTLETLKGVVCAYFMIAFLFAFTYYLIEFLIPGSFSLIQRDISFMAYSRNLSQMMYFSFVTLLTIGFGDIAPLLDVSQTAVVIEGIIGQFYVAILVARIVAVYALITDRKLIEEFLHRSKKRPKK